MILGALGLVFAMTACSGHPYFNTWFNLNRHYEAALLELQNRKDSLPADTIWVSPSEREHWQKVVEKGAKIQSQWPARKDYDAKVLFRTGMAQMHLAMWTECLRNFEDLQRNYPADDSLPAAEYYRSVCLDKKGESTLARFALNQIAANASHPYYSLALAQLARMEGAQGRDSSSLAALEKLLAVPGEPSYLRGQAHYQAAQIYDRSSQWNAALGHYQDSSVQLLARPTVYSARMRAAIMYFKKGDSIAGLQRLELLAADKRFADSLFNTQFVLADYYDLMGQGPKAEKILLEIARGKNRGEYLAHAWYALGERERTRTFFFEKAIQYYDSATIVQSRSVWAQWARNRISGLKTILSSRSAKVEPKVAFQASEAYLFQLDQVDSSLSLLQRISDDSSASLNFRAKSIYAQAFLRESVKKDSVHSDSLWKLLISKYPGTEYAKQAERNLGLDLIQVTAQDSAHKLFLQAESLGLNKLNVASALLDTLARRFPQSPDAPKGLWLKASLLSDAKQLELSRTVLKDLIARFPQSSYADYAHLALEAKSELDPAYLRSDKELLAGLQRNLNDYKLQREREDKLREQMESSPSKGNAEEELLWDYNERYGN